MKTYIDRHSHTLHVPRPQVSAQLWGAVIDCINSWGASSEIKKKIKDLDPREEIAIYKESSKYTAITCAQVVGQNESN